MRMVHKSLVLVLVWTMFSAIVCSLVAASQAESLFIWGPIVGVVDKESTTISLYTSRMADVELYYSESSRYTESGIWDYTVAIDDVDGIGEIIAGGLQPNTTYCYKVVLNEDGLSSSSKVCRFTTAPAANGEFSFLVYGDTRTFPSRHKLVSDTMARSEPDAAFVVNTGDLVESPTIGRFKNLFWAIAELACNHSYLAVIGNHERGHSRYYDFLSLPNGGGKQDEEWWSFDYGNVHFVGLNSNVFTGANAINRMREQIQWLRDDLNQTEAMFKLVFFHHPIYSSTWSAGQDESLRSMWEPIFIENGVDVVFNGHMHCYEHFYNNGIHHVVTGGGGAPLQEPVNYQANGTVFRRYEMLHYVRVTVNDNVLQVETVPVAEVYDDKTHIVTDSEPIDSFTITKNQ